MRLAELAGALAGATERLGDSAGVEIGGLAYDSRSVRGGELFFCVGGFNVDGHEFAPQAVAAGAAALVVERTLGLGVPELLVPSARAAMGPLAARFNGEPARHLKVVGVTGTNGKTTTSYLTRALLEAGGHRCGMLGTVKSIIAGREYQVQRTTPEAVDLQADLRSMLDGGDSACVMEVSSHALELHRTDAIPFAAAIFTNLTQDHLDFHASMEDYFQAKRRLFVPGAGAEPPVASIVNVGDPYGRRLADELTGAITFAVDAAADYRARGLGYGFDGCSFELLTPEGARRVSLPLPGRFNVANALGAVAAARALGVELDVIVAALERGVRVPGRFEPVDEGQPFAVLVDYAHTPDSLENVLAAARELLGAGEGVRLLCVFGAGGDRDRGKRPLMGEIVARLADVAIVTSDNPRSEDPDRIIAEILAGTRDARAEVLAISDRRAAIGEAVGRATAGDVVVIAGKGHEQGQELAGRRIIPFDDVAVAREALQERTAAAAGGPA
jgi:UDP-N-acetylmuramoyl-L-alanyl-D-glutamate--2,6-diaminopimelate ligase